MESHEKVMRVRSHALPARRMCALAVSMLLCVCACARMCSCVVRACAGACVRLQTPVRTRSVLARLIMYDRVRPCSSLFASQKAGTILPRENGFGLGVVASEMNGWFKLLVCTMWPSIVIDLNVFRLRMRKDRRLC